MNYDFPSFLSFAVPPEAHYEFGIIFPEYTSITDQIINRHDFSRLKYIFYSAVARGWGQLGNIETKGFFTFFESIIPPGSPKPKILDQLYHQIERDLGMKKMI